MDWRAMFKSAYLTGVEFQGRELCVTMRDVITADLEGEDGKMKAKAIVLFSDMDDRGWVLCKTNAMCVAAMFGDDTDGWIGKRVTLYAELVQVGPTKKPGIRVRGSPDIKRVLDVSIKLPKKKAFTMRLRPTSAETVTMPGAPRAAPSPAPEVGDDGTLGAPAPRAPAKTEPKIAPPPAPTGGSDRALAMAAFRDVP